MTTILCVRKDDQVVMAGDGQVSIANTIMKPSARKFRRTYYDKVIAGFAGSTADAFTLFEKFADQQWNWRKNGGRTRCFATFKLCLQFQTRRLH